MRFFSIISGILLTAVACFGQQAKFHPTGLVLCPYEKSVEGAWDNVMSNYVVKAAVTEEDKAKFVSDQLPPNWRIIRENELSIMTDQDFFSLLSLSLCREINYKVMEGYSNLLIYPVKDSSVASTVAYKKILTQHQVEWMVNPYKVKLYEKDGKRIIEVGIQVFFNPTNHVQVNKMVLVTEDEVKDTCDDSIENCLFKEMVNRLALISVDRIIRVR